jgi:hypothetical protein
MFYVSGLKTVHAKTVQEKLCETDDCVIFENKEFDQVIGRFAGHFIAVYCEL